jgi:phosphoribosyl 1,2-cyclic phosphate phosphodiesterase
VKLIMLGSGTSTGVPRIGEDWGECDPADPRNRRTRVSIIVESAEGKRLLVDTSPDLRHQLLANCIDKVDAVFWTHDHADHCHGIDDLRVMRYDRSGPLPGFAGDETARRLRARFSYVFAGEHGYPTICELNTLKRLRIFAGFGIGHCLMPHGPARSTGFRFDADGKSIGYATDFSEIVPDMVTLFGGGGNRRPAGRRRRPHPTHAHLEMALELKQRTGARRMVLTHLDKSMDYRALSEELPAGVEAGYDGLEVVL